MIVRFEIKMIVLVTLIKNEIKADEKQILTGFSISDIQGRNSAPFPKPKSMFFPNSR